MALLSNEQARQMVWEETKAAVVEALEPFSLSKQTLERVAEEAAERAVERELDLESER